VNVTSTRVTFFAYFTFTESLFVFGATASSGPGPLFHEVSRSHTTHHSR